MSSKAGRRAATVIALATGCTSLVGACVGYARSSQATTGPKITAAAIKGVPTHPFAPTSIWNRPVPSGATFTDVSAAMRGAPGSPVRIGTDLVTICTTSPKAPPTDIMLSAGWSPAERATATGTVLYHRHLSANACTAVRTNPFGNALFVLVDPLTGLADIGGGAWRNPGGPLLSVVPDGPAAHGIDVQNGDGLVGAGRASGLPALGGLLRKGEIAHRVDHALAVVLPAGVLSAALHWRWPARSADATAAATYEGTDPALTMGTLLAIPPTTDLANFGWHTRQGRVLAADAQRYGWYVADSVVAPVIRFAFETGAATHDLGLTVDPSTGYETTDPARLDATGFTTDVLTILGLMKAVTSNAP